MKITQDEVLAILKLFDESAFHSLQMETEDLKLSVSKGGQYQGNEAPAASSIDRIKTAEASALNTMPDKQANSAASLEAAAAQVDKAGLLEVKAPMLGILYRSPQPGAPPYVEAGAFVKEDDTVALIEVMKLFNAVKAGVRGQIVEVCAENGQLVEYGQALFLVKPADEAAGKTA